MRIVWDEPKRLANIAKHGLDFARLDEAFFERSVNIPAKAGRSKAVGDLDRIIVVAVIRLLGREGVAVVPFRPANRSERRFHEEAQSRFDPDH